MTMIFLISIQILFSYPLFEFESDVIESNQI